MQLNVQQVDSYSKSVNDNCNRRMFSNTMQVYALCLEELEDNTSDTTFLHFKLGFILLSLRKVYLTDQMQVLRLSICKGTTSYVLWLHWQKRPLAG